MNSLSAQRTGSQSMSGMSGGREPAGDNLATTGAGYSRPIISIIISGIVLIAAIVIGAALAVSSSRESALADSERELGNTALLLARHIDQQLETLDHVQNGLIEHMQSLGIATPDDLEREMSNGDVRQKLEHTISAFSFVDAIVITDAAGAIVNSSSGRLDAKLNFADRDYFKALKSNPQLKLYVSEPIQGRIGGGGWKIIAARRLSAPNGEFLGVIIGSIRLAVFEDYFRSITLGEHGLVALQRADGVLLVRHPRNDAFIGKTYTGAIGALGNNERGTVRLAGRMENKEIILAAHRLSHYPLVVSAGMDAAFVLDTWWKQTSTLLALSAAAAVMIAFLLLIIVRQLLQGKRRFQKKFNEQGLQLDVAIRHMVQGLAMFNSALELTVCNDRYREIYGMSPELAKPGRPLVDLLKHRAANGTFYGNPEEYVSNLLATIVKGQKVSREEKTKDGRSIFIITQPVSGGGLVSTHEDITEKRRADMELDETKRFLDLVIENIPAAVVVKDVKTHQYVLINRAFEAMISLPRAEVLGRTYFDLYKKDDAERIEKADVEALQNDMGKNSTDYDLEMPMRGICAFTTNRMVVRDSRGNAKYLVVVIEDVTERRKSEQRIAFMAHHDALTGLANRATLTQKIDDATARQRRWGDPFSVLLLDLDRFKQVNDSLGHPAGDALLREVAGRLKQALRETDVLARLGGDEFAIVQAGEFDQREAAVALAERIIEIIGVPFTIQGHDINIGTSIGIALAPEHATNPDDLLKMADLALYRAKSAGRNGHSFFDPSLSEAVSARQGLENELRRAIQHDEFELYYQPIVDSKTGKIFSAEALIRWQHPTKGMIMPDQFIPLAEESGLITQIGEWVLQTACNDAARWPNGIKVAINLSAVQFRKSNLPDVIMYALAESGLPPERLELEITETALIESAADCLPALHQFKNLGIAVALDDFGTGYSSLSQLTMFPFDRIKIDKSFTQNIAKRAECAAIISAAITLAQSLGISMTAEGVETAEQYKLLRLAGVTSLQGYLFMRPRRVSEIDFDGVYRHAEVENAA